jgi:prephenate dehydrogenase
VNAPAVAVIGLGCIGGSLAQVVRASGAGVRGWGASEHDRELAHAAGIEVPVSLATTVRNAELIVVAVPAHAIAEVARTVIESAPAGATIVHCCGVQAQGALEVDDAAHARIIGAHPIAGSHESGFAAARTGLFAGCTVYVESRATERVRAHMAWLWGIAGADRVEYLDADAQDAMMTWVSHLPQLAATALASALASHGIDPRTAGPGARDTTRLAASPFEQWAPLVFAHRAELADALAQLERTTASIRTALASDGECALESIWNAAREWRRAAEVDA